MYAIRWLVKPIFVVSIALMCPQDYHIEISHSVNLELLKVSSVLKSKSIYVCRVRHNKIVCNEIQPHVKLNFIEPFRHWFRWSKLKITTHSRTSPSRYIYRVNDELVWFLLHYLHKDAQHFYLGRWCIIQKSITTGFLWQKYFTQAKYIPFTLCIHKDVLFGESTRRDKRI